MDDISFVHVRRCHVCDKVTEKNESQVNRCDHCGKNLAPYYFFDESATKVYSVDETLPVEERTLVKDPKDMGPRRPLRGVSAMW